VARSRGCTPLGASSPAGARTSSRGRHTGASYDAS
jgi:hypothetical protein